MPCLRIRRASDEAELIVVVVFDPRPLADEGDVLNLATTRPSRLD